MVAIIVALLVVTNVITGLAVYYLAVPAPGAGSTPYSKPATTPSKWRRRTIPT